MTFQTDPLLGSINDDTLSRNNYDSTDSYDDEDYDSEDEDYDEEDQSSAPGYSGKMRKNSSNFNINMMTVNHDTRRMDSSGKNSSSDRRRKIDSHPSRKNQTAFIEQVVR